MFGEEIGAVRLLLPEHISPDGSSILLLAPLASKRYRGQQE